MSVLLHVDASPRGDTSISRELSREFVRNWREANPTGKVIARDLTIKSLPPMDAEWVGASFTPAESRTEAQNEVLALSEALIAELRVADEYVVGVPMHNFGVPAVLKVWIDLIVRAGETFSYVHGAPVGLLKNKKVTFVVASGAVYLTGSAMAAYNFVDPYLRTIFGFVGITDTTFLDAGGSMAVMQGKMDRQTFLKPHLNAVQALFQAA